MAAPAYAGGANNLMAHWWIDGNKWHTPFNSRKHEGTGHTQLWVALKFDYTLFGDISDSKQWMCEERLSVNLFSWQQMAEIIQNKANN